MAEELVVKDQLSDRMISAGREFTWRLAESDLEFVCTLWLYETDSNRWRFVAATPRVVTAGPLKVYGRIQEVLSKEAEASRTIKLQDVAVISPDHPLVRAIRSAFHVVGSFADIRFSRSRIDDVFIEDSYILFVRPN